MCKVPKGKDRFGANEDNKRKSMRHRKEAINWIAIKALSQSLHTGPCGPSYAFWSLSQGYGGAMESL